MENQNELTHHGVLGQRWGVRRYQNKDGTLTKAGQRRYKIPQTGTRTNQDPDVISDPKGIQRRLNDVDQGIAYNRFDAQRLMKKAYIANEYAQKKLKKNPNMDLEKHKWVKNRIENAKKWNVESVELLNYASRGRQEINNLSNRLKADYGDNFDLLQIPVDRLVYSEGSAYAGGLRNYYMPGTKYKVKKK